MAAEAPVELSDQSRLFDRLDALRDGRAPSGSVEEGKFVSPPAENRDSERLEQLGSCGHVEDGLRTRRDHEGFRARQLAEIR